MNSTLSELATLVLGSPVFSRGPACGSALVDAVLSEARIDQKHHKLIFELEARSYGLFERCISPTQACMLLEWLLEGDSDCCSYQNVRVFEFCLEITQYCPIGLKQCLNLRTSFHW